jgi:hypothetical protein
MSSTTDTAPSVAALEELLSSVRDQTKNEALAQVMSEAIMICKTRHTAHGGISLQLQAALASIRAGRSDEAIRYIRIALDIEARWSCGGELSP